jgi:hypothetical protein
MARSRSDPPAHAAVVTPDDNASLTVISRALYVGGAGNLRILMAGGQTVTLAGITAGSLLPLRVDRVLATGTTATSIVAFW